MAEKFTTKRIDSLSADRVSVIIPAYCVAPYIGETLKSVFAQTKPAFEVIVINDGSPDTEKLEQILQVFRDRIVYLKQENRGPSGARNTGIRTAKGNLIALLDGDDLWMPRYIETQTEFLRSHPEYDLVYCDAVLFGSPMSEGKQFMALWSSEGEATMAAIISRKCNIFVSVTARAESLRECGFDESIWSCEDFDCFLRFTASGRRIGYHRQVLARHRKRRDSLSADPMWMVLWGLEVLEKTRALWPRDSNEGGLIETAIAQKNANLARLRGKQALSTGNVDSAVVQLSEANRYYRDITLSSIILLLRLPPRLMRCLFRLRGIVRTCIDRAG